MGKAGVVKGALKAVADLVEGVPSATRAVVRDITEGFLDDPGSVSKVDRATLLDYLTGAGGKQEWKDTFPGEARQVRVAGPRPGELWLRGSEPRARLSEDRPIFTTRQPHGAAWYATEWPEGGYGAITEYLVDAKNPARQRDMLRMLLQDEGLAAEANHMASGDPYNLFNRLYHPDMRARLRQEGYDSALGLDTLERGDIEALVALDKAQLTPQTRRIVTYEGNRVLDSLKRPPTPMSGGYMHVSEPRPFSKKKVGGLVQMKERRGG